ncbi:MAG: hypothetical protein QM804_11120 [Propionicimonas sp.]
MWEALGIYALIALVIALLIARPLVKRWARQKGREVGERRFADKQTQAAGAGGLGDTLLLATDLATATALVGPVLEAGKRVKRLDDSSWAQTHYNDDDVVYQLTAGPDGVTLAVSRAIEFAHTVNGAKAWQKLRAEIATQAQQRGIAVTEGVRPLAPAEGVEINGAQVWLPVG